MASSRPQHIGGYRVLRPIGEGGAGRVYACRDEQLGRDVAIKVLKADAARDGARRDRFLREGRMMARLRSPHIAAVFAVGEHEGLPFLVMELIEGKDLESRLRDGGPMSVAKALQVAREAALGLEEAARLDIIHRDIKPANLILGPGGHVKLTDFGLARPQDGSATVTSEGLVTGTPAFLAPERAMAKGDDIRSDMYSLGATLYTLIAGQPPFVRETPIEVITAQLNDLAAPLDAVRPGVGPQVAGLVARLMAKDPRQRPQTYAELIAALDECLRELVSFEASQNPFAAPPDTSSLAVGAPTGVMGTLKQMAVAEITQMLEIGRKTAAIDVEPMTADKALLCFVDGQVVYARFGALEGPEAYYALCRHQDGFFRIRYGRPPEGQNIDIPTQFLMLEAMRRVDEESQQRAAPELPRGPDLEPTPPPPEMSTSALDLDRGLIDDPTLPTFLPPSADLPFGGLPDGGGAPPPVSGLGDVASDPDATIPFEVPRPGASGAFDPLAPKDTLITHSGVRAYDDDDDDTHTDNRPTRRRDDTHLSPRRAGASRSPASSEDELDGPTQEQDRPLLSSGTGEMTHPTPDDLDATLLQSNPGFPRDHSRTRLTPLNELLDEVPWLRRLDEAALTAARRAGDRVRERPWLLVAVGLPFVLLVAGLIALGVVAAQKAPPLEARLAAGQAAAVLEEIEAIPAARRTGPQELLRGHALAELGRVDEAVGAYRSARRLGAGDEQALEMLVYRLDQEDAGVEVDLLIDWPGSRVTELLVQHTTDDAWRSRKNAVTILRERGEGDRFDPLEVALKDLEGAPTCALRKEALEVIEKRGKQAGEKARKAVEKAQKTAGNDCMEKMFRKMLPHRYR